MTANRTLWIYVRSLVWTATDRLCNHLVLNGQLKKETLSFVDGPKNEDIKRTIANMFAEFVSNINVDGSDLDYLYQEGIITLHRKDKVRNVREWNRQN